MNIHVKKKMSQRTGLVAGLYFVGAGIFFIVSNVHMYCLFGVFVGIAFCLCAPGLLVAPYKSSLAAAGRQWVYRVAAVPTWCALPLLLVVGVSLWLGAGSTVAAARMIHHPLLYSNRVVHTSGNLLVGGGNCTLLVPSAAGHRIGAKVWLSSKSTLCAATDTTRTHANVSGTFIVLRSTGRTSFNYVLAGATITVADAGNTATST